MKKGTDIEYCNPYNEDNNYFWMKVEHLGRYIYASKLIKKHNYKTVLDVSCADGYGSEKMAKHAGKVYGYDISEENIKKARKKNLANAIFDILDLEEEKINGKFDFIVSFETLEHINNAKEVIRNFYEILNRNGQIIISVPNERFEPTDKEGNPKNKYHKVLFTKDKILNMVKNAGFKEIEVLGQSQTNNIFRREMKLIRKSSIKRENVSEFYNEDKKSMEFFSKLFGIPNKKNIDDSYSFIIKAKK